MGAPHEVENGTLFFYEVGGIGSLLFGVWVLPKVYKQRFLGQPTQFSEIISLIPLCFQSALFTLGNLESIPTSSVDDGRVAMFCFFAAFFALHQ